MGSVVEQRKASPARGGTSFVEYQEDAADQVRREIIIYTRYPPSESRKRDEPRKGKERRCNLAAFWLLGLLNNFPAYIVVACAQNIHSGGVGWVFFCGTLASLGAKLTGPYWFHFISYPKRILLCGVCMIVSFSLIALPGSLHFQLLGVIVNGFQFGMGESSVLGLTSFYETRTCLTCWSSGTGIAGVCSFGWVMGFTYGFGLSFVATVLLANIAPIVYVCTFFFILQDSWKVQLQARGKAVAAEIEEDTFPEVLSSPLSSTMQHVEGSASSTEVGKPLMSKKERATFIAVHLWPYMLPLFVVYFSEYCMLTGAWPAMGFPVSSDSSRKLFYKWAGLIFQAGIFLSKSSGMVFQANMVVLWVMPTLQTALLFFFALEAIWLFWADYSILVLCFTAGLLGGAVYVNSFTLITKRIDHQYHEFSLAAASVADSIGIVIADIVGVFLQCYIYKSHDIPGASVSC